MSNEIDLSDFSKIDGVGPANKKELKAGGFITVIEIAACIPEELMERSKLTETKAIQIIQGAKQYLRDNNLLNLPKMSALEDLERREKIQRIKLNSSALDGLLNGGIECGAVTEFFGEFGSGKSQVSMMSALKCTQSLENGGLDANAIYIDTEGTFRPERIKAICDNLGYDWKKTLTRIHVIKPRDSSEIVNYIEEELVKDIEEFKAKLVVIDSVISLFRAEKIGRGALAARQQMLGQLLHKIGRAAEVYDAAIVLTNQVQSRVDGFIMAGMDPNKPTGGNILGHFSTYRVSLRKSGKGRVATMVDSPDKDWEPVKFMVTKNGIEDFVDDSKKAKKSSEDQEQPSENQPE